MFGAVEHKWYYTITKLFLFFRDSRLISSDIDISARTDCDLGAALYFFYLLGKDRRKELERRAGVLDQVNNRDKGGSRSLGSAYRCYLG